MEYGILFKKTSTCYKNPDIEYLDETSDYKLKILCKQGKITEEEFRRKHDEIARSISYLSKETHGKVYAGGFLRDELLAKKAMAPEKWNNEARKKAIKSAIYKHSNHFGTYRKALGHKLVFSVSDELADIVENSGLKLDELLGREVKKMMYEFQQKFHRGEKIGFAWGIHHDTDHRHVHVYLCNRTNKGRHVAMSNPLKGRRPEPGRKDQIGYMKERCIAARNRMLQQAECMNCNDPVYEEDIKIEKPSSYNLLEAFAKEEKTLDRKHEELMEAENKVKLDQLKINRFYTENNIRREHIAQGWTDIKYLNKIIYWNFSKLKKSENVIPSYLIRQLGYVSSDPTLRQLSQFVYKLHKVAEQDRREQILSDINHSKLLKAQILEQVNLLDMNQKAFNQRLQEMKDEQEKARQDFYQKRREFESEKQRFNYLFYKEMIKDWGKQKYYQSTGIKILEKMKNKVDCSIERKVLKKLDEEARSKAVQQKYDRFLAKINGIELQRQEREEMARREAENWKNLKAWSERVKTEQEKMQQKTISLFSSKRDDDQNSHGRGMRF